MNGHMNSIFERKVNRLNEGLSLRNPVLGSWQNTPRGGVFLSDEFAQLRNIQLRDLSDFESAYYLKRTGDTKRALNIFQGINESEARIQEGFIHQIHKNWEAL